VSRVRIPKVGDFPIDWTPALRQRYRELCDYYRWLPLENEAVQYRMAYLNLYRSAYVVPETRTSTKPLSEPWRDITPAEVDAWRMRDLPARWATTDGIAQCLTWLEDTFAGYDDPEGD